MQREPRWLATELGRLLLRHRNSLTIAESCTGGWLAKLVTDVPGSSGWFERGFVTYSNDAKVEILGVREQTLLDQGAVSAATVCEMAEGALRHSHADLAVAVSGIAGPDGGTPDKPVGLVWIAWARRDEAPQAEQFQYTGDREAVRLQAVETALRGLIGRLGD
jgi:nicotinamide-nucleotide amidase